jgi:tRNA(Arg) A34 adenosine deaminase TadA
MAIDRDAAFRAAWDTLHPAFQRSLDLAYEAAAASGLAAGSVLTDATDRIVAEGRNHAYDPPGGPDVLQGSPLAHAELNVLAMVPIQRELGSCTLWSTQEPCSMCVAAASFTGVGTIRYMAPDPWAIATDQPHADRSAVGPAEDQWIVSANILFLLGIASGPAGLQHPTMARNREREPETAAIVIELVTSGRDQRALTAGRALDEVLASLWDRISAAARARSERLRTSPA